MVAVDHGKPVFDVKIYGDNWVVVTFKDETHDGQMSAMKGMVLAMFMLLAGATGQEKRRSGR